MSLRSRPTPSKQTSDSVVSDIDNLSETPKLPSPPLPLPPPSLPRSAFSQALTSTANLANLLPTGTLLAFQLLTPIFTNNGSCDSVTRLITFILLLILATSCFLASFTDSYRSSDGQVYYGFATTNGMWLIDYQAGSETNSRVPDLSKYKLRFIDGVHAVLSVFVFITVALRDKNVLSCFYPMPAHEIQQVLDIVPIGIGVICSLLFMVFPTKRYGIGYPVTK